MAIGSVGDLAYSLDFHSNSMDFTALGQYSTGDDAWAHENMDDTPRANFDGQEKTLEQIAHAGVVVAAGRFDRRGLDCFRERPILDGMQ